MKKDWIRSLKYLIWLGVLFGVIFILMIVTETARGDAAQMLDELLHTTRGWMMIGALMVLAYFYPRFGFTVRRVAGNLEVNREQLLEAARRGGFSLIEETPQQLLFRASSPLKRALLLWEDTISVQQQGEEMVLDGIRKEVVRMEFRLKGLMSRDE